jgi:hypothetical protein
MKENKETKRIQYTIEELKTLEFHLGNELETYFEIVKEATEREDWEEVNEWRPAWLELERLYNKTFKKYGLVGKWRWWYNEEETETQKEK